jgi:DNA-binding transcriptional ArsR family regulator
VTERKSDQEPELPPSEAEVGASVESIFHALDDGTRRAMVETLTERPCSVTHLANSLGISLTAVGQHLDVLERAGLVRTEKTGRVRLCSLESAGFAVLEAWARDRRRTWEKQLDRLSKVLDEE